MSRLRSLESLGDFCSLPSPRRIPQGVAGMAFNFSQVEVEPAIEQVAANGGESTRNASSPSRTSSLSARFGIPRYSPAT
jgi:hypothetical protein